MSQPCQNPTWRILIVSPRLVCFSPQITFVPALTPLFSSLHLTFFVPLFIPSPSPTRCLLTSCAQMAERSRRDGFLWSKHALKQLHVHAPTSMQRVSRIDLRQQGARTFVPESEDLPVFSHIYSLCMTTSIWNRCPKLTFDCRQTWATVREGQEFGCFSANWISISPLCVWLIGKWLDCRFSARWGQRGFVAKQVWLSQYFMQRKLCKELNKSSHCVKYIIECVLSIHLPGLRFSGKQFDDVVKSLILSLLFLYDRLTHHNAPQSILIVLRE